ncbi:unnamed protein product [Cylindrotheca closterium]|nr:unnamed protein product [Cylindrotheca closterium]
MGSATNRLMGAFAVVLLLLVSINMKVLSMNAVYDLKERMGDNVMENFKILPANRLVHVSRAGIGHRMVRDTSAYHLAKGLDLARLKLQWGSCSKDTNWKGNEGFDELSIFPHLFGNDLWNVPGTLSGPKREGKKVIARNDVYGYIPGESYKTYHIPIQREIYEGEDGPFFDKLQSDSEFYDKLVDSYMFKDEVEAFMEEHNFAEHEVIGIHLSAGNGEEKHKIEDERKFMKNILYLVSQYVRLMKMLYHDRFARRTPLIFLATDTPRLIPEVQAATEKFGVKTVVLDQIRVEDNEGVTYKALAGKEETCLEGWKAMTSDMMLLSHSDVVIAARPSAFTQGLPLSRVFDKHVDEEGPHYCEVGDDGNYMSCLEDKKTWLFRDNIRKVVPISRSQGINGLFDPEFPQVVHNLLIQLPDVVHPNEFQEVKKFLDGKRGENQGDILKHVYGEKAIFGKYKDNLKHEPKWNFED